MQRSLRPLYAVLVALICVTAVTSTATAQEKAGTRAMRRQAQQDTDSNGNPEIKVTCQPETVVAASMIQYILPRTAKVSVRVYDEAGREVAVLDNQKRHAGLHQVIFDRRDLPNGTYYCKVVVGKTEVTRRLILVDNPG